MYFETGGIGWFFSRSAWIFLAITFGLAMWKIVDLFVWLFSHIKLEFV